VLVRLILEIFFFVNAYFLLLFPSILQSFNSSCTPLAAGSSQLSLKVLMNGVDMESFREKLYDVFTFVHVFQIENWTCEQTRSSSFCRFSSLLKMYPISPSAKKRMSFSSACFRGDQNWTKSIFRRFHPQRHRKQFKWERTFLSICLLQIQLQQRQENYYQEPKPPAYLGHSA